MEFVIITGMSGAGKTGALHVLEDIGYYCVDNLPSSLLSTLYRLCLKSEDDSMKRVAVVVDVRGNEKFEEMCSQIERFKRRYENVKVLFFDATTDRLVVRYKETRRRHPLTERLKDGSVAAAVKEARKLANGRHITFIASICGTDGDFQNRAEQQRRLEDAGVIVLGSNAQAGMLAAEIMKTL